MRHPLCSAIMFAKWGPATVTVALACFLVVVAAPAAAASNRAGPHEAPPSVVVPTLPPASGGATTEPAKPGGGSGGNPKSVSTTVSERLAEDGSLDVVERVDAPEGRTLTRQVPLRFAAGEDSDRIFAISDGSVDGDGSIDVNDDRVLIRVTGPATISYTVGGAVVDAGDHEEVRWQPFSGWDATFGDVGVSFAAPEIPRTVTCYAGSAGSTARCSRSGSTASGLVTAEQRNMHPGHRLDLAVRLPDGTVPANAVTATTSAFALTPTSGAGLVGIAVLLLLGVAVLWFVRGRDVRLRGADPGPVEVLLPTPDGGVTFSSPDGVLPGQVGTVIDEHVDVIDVAATVLDLAVRNYLWISETAGSDGGPDWWLARRQPADEALTEYERAVYAALVPDGTEAVLLSELASGTKPDLLPVRDALYSDVVRRRWFSRRPDTERGRWFKAGIGVVLAGVVATVALAVTIGSALIGVGGIVGGGVLTLAARWMPARTLRGSLLMHQVGGLRTYLDTAGPAHVPERDAEMVFSRSLPYAVVLGKSERWLAAFSGMDTAADGETGLYWFAMPEDRQAQRTEGEVGAQGTPVATRTGDLSWFAERFPTFVAALHGVLARSGALRASSD